MLTRCLNYVFEHIQHDHVQRSLSRKRTHWPVSELCLIDPGYHKISLMSFLIEIPQILKLHVTSCSPCVQNDFRKKIAHHNNFIKVGRNLKWGG